MSKIVLYSYPVSSCSWRVRIGLALKGVKHDVRFVNLEEKEQTSDEYKALNPQGKIPTLVVDGNSIAQSLSILEYLDEVYPQPPILPRGDPLKRAEVRALALMIVADIQPVQAPKVAAHAFGDKKEDFSRWAIETGFVGLERALEKTAGKYCYGNEVTLPDVCLVPQVFNARRFGVDMTRFPVISRIDAELSSIEAFVTTHPGRQSDCPGHVKPDHPK